MKLNPTSTDDVIEAQFLCARAGQSSENPSRPPALRQLSFQIRPGITLLVGRTGAGKTTLLNALAGVTPPESGTLLFSGLPLWQGRRVTPELQAQIGLVFQMPEQQLFARTVQGEFDYSLRPLRLPESQVAVRTAAALQAVELPPSMAALPPLTLSGGQKRRVALAATFAANPNFLFLDEPTAGLDAESTQALTAYLKQWVKTGNKTAVIATHDLDAFLPAADAVMVLCEGQLLAYDTPQAIASRPDVLIESGVGLPSGIELIARFRELGLEVHEEVVKAAVGEPDEMAKALLAHPPQRLHSDASLDALDASNAETQAAQAAPQAMTLEACDAERVDSATHPRTPLVQQLDPRAKWLFYLLTSLGLLAQSSWFGWCIGVAITTLVTLLSRTPWPNIWRLVRPFLWFVGFSVLLSGVRFGNQSGVWHAAGIGFSMSAASTTLLQLAKVLLVMVLGILLTATTSTLRMKQGLEQALHGLKRLKLPIEAFALGASLMLRFVPVLMQEQQRFSVIVRVRGKAQTKPGAIRLRDARALIIPLILSVFQLGEDLSQAMEARGYTHTSMERTSAVQLKFSRADAVLMAASAVIAGLLWWIHGI
ncbi:ATP-binding cassette domain-containing protein [Alicyclobacillus tolerans]|uniref:ATP-binding cassette domain-containing protein n=1 Tax=Alicyclobacillus tolerans TaxID=90970 RepID=UPI001F007987|nr:ATP-binding cassette domain-containing protein [Alicyclobacillus tolerans]MCF8566417.1 ATP-binding cassette domain-containing protein [Alicyclobacillus tolerans]